MHRAIRSLAASLWIALSPLAAAQADGDPIDTQVAKIDAMAAHRGRALVASKVSSDFANLAGSKEKALALANALHDGTYARSMRPMGWGDVKMILTLAQHATLGAGITRPSPEQLGATLGGILRMRADGIAWGRIAKAHGVKTGRVLTDLKMTYSKVAALPPTN
jgi:hypothetical protein